MRQRFRQWLASLDPATREVIRHSELTWLAVGVISFGVIGIATLVPGPRELFQLRVGPPLVCGAIAILVPIAGTAFDRRYGLPPTLFGVLYLAVTALFLLFVASLVACSAGPGAFIFAAVFFLLAAFYGHHQLASLRYPYSLAATGLALAGAWWLDPSPASDPALLVVAPTSLGASFVLGSLALAREAQRARTEALRAAIDAQILQEHTTDLNRLSDTIVKILESNHDASNALSAALFNAETLLGAAGRHTGEPRSDENHAVAKDLHQNLLRLQDLVSRTRHLGRSEGADIASLSAVELAPVLESILAGLRRRFPDVALEGPLLETPRSGPGVQAMVSGGVRSLERVCENVLLNACEGDGRRGARRVTLRVQEAPGMGALVILVEDDGPGLPTDLIAGGIRGFRTTKPGGTGLGLYTAERLVRASGGSIALGTAPGGGGRVAIYLTEHART